MGKIGALLTGIALIAGACVYLTTANTMQRVPLVLQTANGPVRLTVEVATTPRQQERGLMHRQRLAPDAGMLFDLHSEKRVSLWMKDTLIPLDMIFIKGDGTITEIVANAKPLSLDTVLSSKTVRAVLEVPGGRSTEIGLKPGDRALGSIFAELPP